MRPSVKATDVRRSPPTGRRYVLAAGRETKEGVERSFYGIWDSDTPGPPVRWFPATKRGWREAWAAFSALEPEAAQLLESRWGERAWRRAAVVGWVLVILGVFVGLFGACGALAGSRNPGAVTPAAWTVLAGALCLVVGLLLVAGAASGASVRRFTRRQRHSAEVN